MDDVKLGQKVFVYYNLHKHLWSIKDVKTGRVIAHKYEVRLYRPEFKVNEKGRQRVLRDKRKNVHAGVEGYVTNHSWPRDSEGKYVWEEWNRVTYNPYKYTTFVTVKEKTPIGKAFWVTMHAFGKQGRGSKYGQYPENTNVRPTVTAVTASQLVTS